MNDFNQTDIASGYELTLSKAANKSEAFDILRSILKELDICESKLKEISYGMERSTGLVHKLVVRFGDGNASQSFNSFAQNESNLNKYGFSEMIKTGNNEFSNETNLSESILVISHHDDSFLNCKAICIYVIILELFFIFSISKLKLRITERTKETTRFD